MERCTDPWLDARGVGASTTRAGREHLYVPGELLVRSLRGDDHGDLAAELERAGATRDPGIAYDDETAGARLRWRPTPDEDDALARVQVERWYLDPSVDASAVASRLDDASGDEVAVAPHHVLAYQPYWGGGPGGPPRTTTKAPPAPPAQAAVKGAGVSVAVLDTGIVADWQSNGWFDTRVVAEPGDVEELDADADTVLDQQAGHGTFIAGVIAAEAPLARIRTMRVMSSYGLVSDVQAAAAILAVSDHDVISLSFGGYCQGDRPPPTVTSALAFVRPEAVVVAAAGNAGSDRLFWPAAVKSVIAVGAHDGGEPPQRACFSNFGWWVDCCALGVDVHSVFVAFDNWPPGPAKEDFEGHALWSGTSFAAPLVAGRIAALAESGGMTPRDAAYQLVRAPGLTQLADLGTLIA